jgi:hypothetical protein
MFRSRIPPKKRQKKKPKQTKEVTVRNLELEFLHLMFPLGKFYQIQKTPRVRLYRNTVRKGSFDRLVLNGDMVFLAKIDPHPYIKNLFRFFVIRGEDVGFLMFEKDQSIERLKLIDMDNFQA